MRSIKLIFLAFFISSCIFEKENNTNLSLSGWWVYGEGLHSFKDEKSLEEYNLQFLNEDSLELIELYLSIVEMEYFPMETNITGVRKDENFYVDNFEITYVVGCDEQ
tara:strand:+ start:780 stop:1100 length:321 start_codon:yes stop_codon:yes gene_type:complete